MPSQEASEAFGTGLFFGLVACVIMFATAAVMFNYGTNRAWERHLVSKELATFDVGMFTDGSEAGPRFRLYTPEEIAAELEVREELTK